MITSFLLKIVDIFFPQTCYGCKMEGSKICDECLNKCKKTIDILPLYITSIYSFKDPLIKQAIHEMKYYHRRDLVEPLTKELTIELGKSIDYKLSTINWILVPIPMSRLRKYIRGYNQAELIAQNLSQKLSLPIKNNLLIRSRSPKRQVQTQNKNERIKNQHNSFSITSDVSGLNIILIDDVTTTCSTLNEARKVLIKAGANMVKAVTIAH